MKDIHSIRRQYGQGHLYEKDASPDPFKQFESWLNVALNSNVLDATAMVLSTIDEQGHPDARVVLLKEFNSKGFVFFTHYNSPKGIQAEKNGFVALTFFWAQYSRQIRIKGNISRITREESVAYFQSRPIASQIGSLTSHQSQVIASLDELEKHYQELAKQYEGKTIPCPETWGGYLVTPFEFEFFQGRDYRMNDRLRYSKHNDQWKIVRLSP